MHSTMLLLTDVKIFLMKIFKMQIPQYKVWLSENTAI